MERDFLSLITSHLLASEVINAGVGLAEICRYPNFESESGKFKGYVFHKLFENDARKLQM